MKPYRTTLLEDAASGSVRASLHDSNAFAAPLDDGAWQAQHAHAESSPSAALRERLSQTRARIARAHAANPPQIDVDWDPDEPPTRVYQGQPLLSPRALARGAAVRREQQTNPLTAYAFEQFRARVTQRPAPPPTVVEHVPAAPARIPARDISLTQRATAQLPKAGPSAVAAPAPPVLPPERRTLPPFASRVLQEATLMGERIGKLYEGLDRSDAALRRRVAYCSLALLVIAASSRMLFGGHSDAAPQSPTAVKQTVAPVSANVAISSDPPGAQIFLNGRASSQVTPAKLTDLAPGRHMIGLKLAGYADAKEALHVPGDTLVSIKLASLDEPRFAPEKTEERPTLSRAEQRAQARELARERRAAARAAKVLLRYRARMGLPPDPVAQELVEAYGPTQSAE